jgi:AraC family transcriptional regulator
VLMKANLDKTPVAWKLSAMRSREWMHRMMNLLEAAVGQLHDVRHPAQGALLEATLLLRRQIPAVSTDELLVGKGCLPAWQVRKVGDYIDSHITEPLLVSDLCAVIQRSEAHFSRSFKRTCGESPHSFVVRRRVELAARNMLLTDASLSDIALQCGFADQAHLCKQFRHLVGQTPAAWRRTHRLQDDEPALPHIDRAAIRWRNPAAVAAA